MVICMAMLSSCSNEDITVGNMVTMKVNPSGVITPFKYEMNSGELEGLSESYKLRTRILVYDENGQLKESDTQYLSNYSNIMTSSMALPYGKYIVIAITDVVKMPGSNIEFEYWLISGEKNLSQLKVTDAGYIGGKNKILGVGKQVITIDDDNNDSFVVKCTPAGAICLTYYCDIHRFSDVEKYGVLMTKSSESISYDNSGNYAVSVDNNGGNYDWWLDYIEPKDYTNYSNIYGYYFVLPMNSVKFKFIADTEDDRINLSNEYTMNLEMGKQYLFMLDLLDDNEQISSMFIELSDDSYAPEMRIQEQDARIIDSQMCNQSIYVKDLF